jgi:hypothetical protein
VSPPENTIEPRHRHPLHSTAAVLEAAFKNITATKPEGSKPNQNLRPIIVYGLSDAQAAAQAALELGHSELTLLSPMGIAHSLGPQWFNALVRHAQATSDDIKITGILDCGKYEGHVMLALQTGLHHVYFTGDADTAEKLTSLAQKSGATLHRSFTEVLDLKGKGDQFTACRVWLSSADLQKSKALATQ